jgi:hypothetical protein
MAASPSQSETLAAGCGPFSGAASISMPQWSRLRGDSPRSRALPRAIGGARASAGSTSQSRSLVLKLERANVAGVRVLEQDGLCWIPLPA